MPWPSSDRTPEQFSDATRRAPQTLVTHPESRSTALYVHGAGDDTPHTFQQLRRALSAQLKRAPSLNRGTWQTMDVSGSDAHATRELLNYVLFYSVPDSIAQLIEEVQPDMPWAEHHFLERVSRVPVNPPPSHVDWPWHGSDKARHLEDGVQFSHTYPERFWPRYANWSEPICNDETCCPPNRGIRFEYGNLDGVVHQLIANPLTRQAVLPVWFPEDTGAIDRRVPCTLTYHFMADADMRLHMWYSLRACDFVRHFHNDVYFAARLLQWVIDEVDSHSELVTRFEPGNLNMTISNLHVFEGDLEKMP